MLAGKCCPTVTGMFLGCCESPAVQMSVRAVSLEEPQVLQQRMVLPVPALDEAEFSQQGWALSTREEVLAELELEVAPPSNRASGASSSPAALAIGGVAMGAFIVAAIGLYYRSRLLNASAKAANAEKPKPPMTTRRTYNSLDKVELPAAEPRPSLVPPPPSDERRASQYV